MNKHKNIHTHTSAHAHTHTRTRSHDYSGLQCDWSANKQHSSGETSRTASESMPSKINHTFLEPMIELIQILLLPLLLLLLLLLVLLLVLIPKVVLLVLILQCTPTSSHKEDVPGGRRQKGEERPTVRRTICCFGCTPFAENKRGVVCS